MPRTRTPEQTAPAQQSRADLLRFRISGFRSLRDFEIGIVPGLNIITGRNGSGKTNFIEFLDFLSLFIDEGLGAAVSTLGGTNRVFSQETLRSKTPRVTVHVSGTASLGTRDGLYSVETDTPLFRFDYYLELRLIKKVAIVIVSKESLTFYGLHGKLSDDEARRAIGSIAINRRYDPASKSVVTTNEIGPRLLSSSVKNPLRYLTHYRRTRDRAEIAPADERAKAIEEYIVDNIDESQSLFSRSYYFNALAAIDSTLSRTRAFNLLPSQIRKLSNITDEPRILPDGSGLSAVIYHMTRAYEQGSSEHYMHEFKPDMLPKVISWTNFLIPELKTISATADLGTGKYVVTLGITSADATASLRVPLQGASDGTLKWLALASRLAQSPRYLSIEEPENFLHPQMQSFFIQMLRDSAEDEGDLRYILLSTHSETIINNCDPSELIIFEFVNQKSRCRRVSNREKLIEQMNKTGFGLGHYYAANAVS